MKLSILTGAALTLAACSPAGSGRVVLAADNGGKVQWLFVQSARSGNLEGTTLTLDGVSPTLFFSDRPVRIEGQMKTQRLVDTWGAGEQSFSEDPPNAVLSVLGGAKPSTCVVELREPKLAGEQLTFQAKVLKGTPPGSFQECSLFIDDLGIPGATLGLGMSGAVESSYSQPSVEVSGSDSYYRAWSPPATDPLNPNLAHGQPAYHFANEENGPPQLGLQSQYPD